MTDVAPTTGEVADSIPGATVLVFRGPDGIRLELFLDPSLEA